MYVAPTPQPALDTSAFDAFLEQQDIKYDIEIELLRDTYVSANGNMESVHSMAETLGLKVRASSAYDNTPSHQSPYLPRHPSLVEHGLKSSGNGSDAELEIDELSSTGNPVQSSLASPAHEKLVDPLEKSHWEKIHSVIMVSRNAADVNEEREYARRSYEQLKRGTRREEAHDLKESAPETNLGKTEPGMIVPEVRSPYKRVWGHANTRPNITIVSPGPVDDRKQPLALVPAGPNNSSNTRTVNTDGGSIKEGRSWANVIIQLPERKVLPKKTYTALNEWRDWNPALPTPRNTDVVKYLDVDIESGAMWSWPRAKQLLSAFQSHDEIQILGQNSAGSKSVGTQQPQMWHPRKVRQHEMDENDFNAVLHSVTSRAGRHEFPLIVSEVVAVLKLLWSMKDSEDDLYVCNSSYLIACRMNNVVTMGITSFESKDDSSVVPLVEFMDYVELLLLQRRGRTAFVHVRDIAASPEFQQAMKDALPYSEDDEALERGVVLFDNIVSIMNRTFPPVSKARLSSNENQDRDNLLAQLTKSSERTIAMFVCPHITNQCQIGVAACRACSMQAYRRYCHGASGDYKMSRELPKGRHKLRVHYGNDKDFFQPYSEVELISIIKYFGTKLAPDIHPIVLAHDPHLFWNIIRYFGSVLQAIRIIFPLAQSNDILIEWARMGHLGGQDDHGHYSC